MRPEKKPQRPSPEGLHAQKIREAADALDEAFIAGDPPNSQEVKDALGESHAAWEAGMASLGQERPKPIEKPLHVQNPRRPLRCRLRWHKWESAWVPKPDLACELCGEPKP